MRGVIAVLDVSYLWRYRFVTNLHFECIDLVIFFSLFAVLIKINSRIFPTPNGWFGTLL